MAEIQRYFNADAVGNGDGLSAPNAWTTPAQVLAGIAQAIADGDVLVINITGLFDIYSAVFDTRVAGLSGPGWVELRGNQDSPAVFNDTQSRILVRNVSNPILLSSVGGLKWRFNKVGLIWNRAGDGGFLSFPSAVDGMGWEIVDCPVKSNFPTSRTANIGGCAAVSGINCFFRMIRVGLGDGFSHLVSGNYMSGAQIQYDHVTARRLNTRLGIHNASAQVSLTNSAIVECPEFNNVDAELCSNNALPSGTTIGSNPVIVGDWSAQFTDYNNNDFTLVPSSVLMGAAVGGNSIGADAFPPLAAPVVTAHPSPITITEGDPGSTASMTVAFTGNPTPTVQWQSDDAGDNNFTDVVGETAATINFTGDDFLAADSGTQYRAVLLNSEGTVTSNPAGVTVNPASFLITQSPTEVRRDGAFSFRVSGTAVTPTALNTTIIADGEEIPADSVTNLGGGDYQINGTVPYSFPLQSGDYFWTIEVGVQSKTTNTVIPLLPPVGMISVRVTDPQTAQGTVFYQHTGAAPTTGIEVFHSAVTAVGGIAVSVLEQGGWWRLASAPVANDSFQVGAVTESGVVSPLATFTYEVGASANLQPIPNQVLNNQQNNTLVEFPEFTITATPGIDISAILVAGSGGEWQWDNGGGYGAWTTAAQTVQNGWKGRIRHMTNTDLVGAGSNTQAVTNVVIGTITFSCTSNTRAAAVPTITEQPNGSNTTSVGSTITVNAGVTGYQSLQWYSNGVVIPDATSLPLLFSSGIEGDYALTFSAESSEGGIVTSDVFTVTVTQLPKRIVVGPLYDLDGITLLSSTTITGRVRNSSTGVFLINETNYVTDNSGYITIDDSALNQVSPTVFFEYITEIGDYIGFEINVEDVV